MKYEKQLPRTEYVLLKYFESHNQKGIDYDPDGAYRAGLKLKEKGWTKSWYYQTTIKPFIKNYKTKEVVCDE